MVSSTMIPLTPALYHLSHDSNGQRSPSVVVVNSFFLYFSLQESFRGRPREIPHNEKLLSLKYEVKQRTIVYCGNSGNSCFYLEIGLFIKDHL